MDILAIVFVITVEEPIQDTTNRTQEAPPTIGGTVDDTPWGRNWAPSNLMFKSAQQKGSTCGQAIYMMTLASALTIFPARKQQLASTAFVACAFQQQPEEGPRAFLEQAGNGDRDTISTNTAKSASTQRTPGAKFTRYPQGHHQRKLSNPQESLYLARQFGPPDPKCRKLRLGEASGQAPSHYHARTHSRFRSKQLTCTT